MGVRAPHIEVRRASFRFSERVVFRALDLDVYPGEVLTVLGPNGCGKSTLLRCLGGILTLDEGTVRIGQCDIRALDVRSRAQRIGFLFQDHIPSFPFPVLDVVCMGRTPHLSFLESPAATDIALAEEALDQVGIMGLKNRPYTELSGGERQLVLLARTLVQQPVVILLDEPTTHLDSRNQVHSLKKIGALAGQGRSVIMTTHDPNQAFLFPGRTALMHPGGSVTVGPAAEVITGPSLSASYGTDIQVLTIARSDGRGEFKFCTPWYN
jgi:iron complex transport system ATP-binding protein